MKKFLLILSIFVVSLSAIAADLNPFAYGLRSSVNASNPMQLDIRFSINAPATSVKVVVYDIATKTDVYTYSCTAYNEKHDYALSLDLSNIPGQYRGGVDNLGWRVDVKGAAVNTPTVIDQEYYLYHPRSIDIDNNPENPNFGHVFVIEGLHDITTKTGTTNGASGKPYNKYLSWGVGAGLYVFDAAFRNLPTPNATAGYNGGITYTAAEKITVNGTGYNVYAPNRVHVSDDGRVFITLCAPVNRGVLFEADKYIFSDAEDRPANWSATGWKKVLVGTRDANTEELEDASGNFIAALNCDIDTKGSGENLQIMLLSGTKNALQAVSSQYTFSEYNIRESSTWNTVPTNKWTLDNTVVAYNVAQIVYDNEGGYWFCQHRGTSSDAIKFPTLMHVNKDGVIDLREKMLNRGGAGICFNKDFTKLIVSGKSSNKSISGVSTATSYTTGTAGWATIYKVDKENGKPKLTMEYEIDMTSIGNNLPGFAWDHANNIYACGYSLEKLKAWALPRTADEVVSTPAASRFAFEVNCASDESYVINVTADATRGSATITAGFDAEGKVPACNPVEVFAQSKDGYKFVCWKEGSTAVSTDNPYTFSAVKDVTLTAHFEEGDYTVTWWNLFKNDNDIAHPIYDKTLNSRLWRLYQVELNNFDNSTRADMGMHTPSGKNSRFHVAGFYTNRNDMGFEVNEAYLLGNSHPVSGKTNNQMFKWLSDYLVYMNGNVAITDGVYHDSDDRMGYFMYLFINRTDTAYDGSLNNSNCIVIGDDWSSKHEFWKKTNGAYDKSKKFIDYGKPEHWRKWWTRGACGLPWTVGSESRLPVAWKRIGWSGKTIADKDNPSTIYDPSTWYQWNTISDPNDEYILAWRDGSKTGRIVHNVYRDNMELHVSYVKKHIEENDPVVKQPNEAGYDPDDASNNDVLQLLRNPNFAAVPQHKLTMTRNITAGMYNTICLPFELTTLVGTPYDGAQILQINTTTTEDEVLKINFIPLTVSEATPMKAGVPYLIQKPTDVTGVQSFSSARFPEIQEYESNYKLNDHGGLSVDVGAITFHGVINPTDIPQGSIILVANNRLAEVTETGQMAGFRGYFTWNDPVRKAPSRMEITVGKQVTTDVEEITDPQPTKQPTQPKVRKVMYDGKIYILRGDEVYTITGHRVK